MASRRPRGSSAAQALFRPRLCKTSCAGLPLCSAVRSEGSRCSGLVARSVWGRGPGAERPSYWQAGSSHCAAREAASVLRPHCPAPRPYRVLVFKTLPGGFPALCGRLRAGLPVALGHDRRGAQARATLSTRGGDTCSVSLGHLLRPQLFLHDQSDSDHRTEERK